MNNSFPIGAWIYLPLSKTTKKDVEHWRDCGLTLTMSPSYNPETDDKQKMLEIMDYCLECGIKLIIWDKRSTWDNAYSNPEEYRKRFRAAYNDFGKHKATFGFHIGDEPLFERMDDLVTAYKIQCEEAPELTPFVNHFPFYKPEIKEFIDELFEKMPPKLISYDCYNQMSEGETDSYFNNIRLYREYADKYNVPLFTSLLSIGHMHYAEPKEKDFIWQLNTAVASGCNGILWFLFYTFKLHLNYRNGPINKFGERSETFRYMSDAIREFHLLYGNYFKDLTLKKCYHIGTSFGGYPLFKEGDSEDLLNITDLRGTDAILSFFTDKNGKDYIVLVCNSRTEIGNLELTFSNKAGKLIRLGGEEEIDLEVRHIDEKFERNKTTFKYTTWLAPGQMYLLRLDK